MAREHLSAKDLAVCLGMSGNNAGKATDAAMKRIAPIFIDHQAAAHRMLADAIDKARSERPSLDDRRRRAGGQGVALEPLTEAEYYEMVAQREGRADLPRSEAEYYKMIAQREGRADPLAVGDGPLRGTTGCPEQDCSPAKRGPPPGSGSSPGSGPPPDLEPVETT